MQSGVALYVAGSLLLAAAMAYGGCEVAAIPALIFRRRLVVYCPFNAVDAAERSPGGGRVPGCSRRGRARPPAPAVPGGALGSLALTRLAPGLSGLPPPHLLC